MTDRELEQKLADSVERTAPDDLEAILSRCGAQNGSVMKLNALQNNPNIIDVDAVEVKPKRKRGRWLAAACAALALLGAGGGGLAYYQSCAVASVVSLDVNPSIELKVSRNERVISCAALNTEAAAVLFSMDGGADLKGAKLDVAVNAIVGALVREGYLDSISSAILISVEDNDQARAQRLQAELVASVDGVLQTQAPGTSVLSQVLDADTPASEYMTFDSGLSAGKSALVHKVMEMNGTLATNSTTDFDRLAALSVEELNDLLEAGELRIPIGKPAACMAAETYAGTAALNSVTADVDPELDEGVYEVELKTAWGEFEYIVDAFTGEVLSGQKDLLNQTSAEPPAPDPVPAAPDPVPETPVAEPQLPEAATPSPSTSTQVPQSPASGGYGYQWGGHHGNGHHSERHYRNACHSGCGASSFTDIGQAAVKAAALNHAGLVESQTAGMEVKQDWDSGWLEYKVEFESGGVEYEYTVCGYTGAILEYEWDD